MGRSENVTIAFRIAERHAFALQCVVFFEQPVSFVSNLFEQASRIEFELRCCRHLSECAGGVGGRVGFPAWNRRRPQQPVVHRGLTGANDASASFFVSRLSKSARCTDSLSETVDIDVARLYIARTSVIIELKAHEASIDWFPPFKYLTLRNRGLLRNAEIAARLIRATF